jgi:hypothetical protein
MRLSEAAGATISNRPRPRVPPDPNGSRAWRPDPETGWAVEADEAHGNRSAIPTASWKTPPPPPPAFPTATHSPDDEETDSTTLGTQTRRIQADSIVTTLTEDRSGVASLRLTGHIQAERTVTFVGIGIVPLPRGTATARPLARSGVRITTLVQEVPKSTPITTSMRPRPRRVSWAAGGAAGRVGSTGSLALPLEVKDRHALLSLRRSARNVMRTGARSRRRRPPHNQPRNRASDSGS